MEEKTYTFEAYICKANSNNAGFFALPNESNPKLSKNDQVYVKILDKQNIEYYAKVRDWRKLGVYVPKKIANEHNLCQKTSKIEITKIDGFQTKIGNDGGIYIPNRKGKKLNLEEEKIIEIEGRIKGKNETVFRPVNYREKENTVEYRITFDKRFAGEDGVFRIQEVYDVSSEKEKISKDLRKVLKPFDWIAPDDTVRVFDGNKVPVQMTSKLDLSSIAYYLGAYYADGTKKGNSWGIAASTFQQAKFYRKSHRSLFKDPDIDLQLTYTASPSSQIEESTLTKKWEEKICGSIDLCRIIETESRNARNRNEYGSLYLREHKILIKEIYNRMLSVLIERIMKETNKELAWDFLLGFLEGDGAPNATERGHVSITTNNREIGTLKKIFELLDLEGDKYCTGMNKSLIRIGSLELICNLELIGDKIFHLYPKRRRKTIRRLLDTGAARFILGKQESTAGWVKNYLKEGGILNEKFNLTGRGRKIRGKLGEMSEELP